MLTLSIVLWLSSPALALPSPPAFPPPAERRQWVESLSREMERLDGEGLLVREGRPRNWAQLRQLLAAEAEAAPAWPDLLRVFRRLDQAYANLHARFRAGEGIESASGLAPAAAFAAEWLGPADTRLRISRVDEASFPADLRPARGDELIALNDRPVDAWLAEHFDFCKWPLREQCDLEFARDFFRETAGWARNEPLRYTLARGDRRWTVNVPVRPEPPRERSRPLCAREPARYAGFRLAHAGKYACFFERENDSSTLLLRITSFHYESGAPAEAGPASVQEEVDAFLPYWRARAPFTRHLVIDVSDNGGGNVTTPYYEVFFDRPYQEQWARFKKIPELRDRRLRAAMFWETPEQELWFRNLQREGVWRSIPYGDFLPPVPMFCAGENRDCREGLFPVNNPGFRGQVTFLVNQGCVSSCDGFVFAFREQLGERVRLVGQPQAADTAYARLRIGIFSPGGGQGFSLRVLPEYSEPPPGLVLSQTVSVTRSVRADGTVVSGQPLPLDRFVPNPFEREGRWTQDALDAALGLEL